VTGELCTTSCSNVPNGTELVATDGACSTSDFPRQSGCWGFIVFLFYWEFLQRGEGLVYC